MEEISLKTTQRCQLVNVTATVADVVAKHPDASAALIFVPHTTAGVTINEAADPDVADDLERFFSKLIPPGTHFRHSEGNSDAHVLSTLVGPSLTVPMIDGRLVLGTWQGIYFAEFDGPRTRKIIVRLLQ